MQIDRTVREWKMPNAPGLKAGAASMAVICLMVACATSPPLETTQQPVGELTLATTTSTQDSGLLSAIVPLFEKKYNVRVKVVAVGTGQALKLGEDGNADVVLVHARKQEDEFIAKGWGINRRDVMYNDFIVVGSIADPALAAGSPRASIALQKISDARAAFASRGDGSGTHTKEKEIWSSINVAPAGAWYSSLGQGMGETLGFANEKSAYTLADRATWLAQRSRLRALRIIAGGERIEENQDAALLNPYGVIPVNPARHPQTMAALAEKFAEWITSTETQELIYSFRRDVYGMPLFRPSSAQWKTAHPSQ